MRIALLALALAVLPDERAERFFDRMKIEAPDLADDVSRRVVVRLLQKEHWVGAFTEISDRFGRFSEDLQLTIDFKLEAEEVAQTLSRANDRRITFNLKKLVELQKQLDGFAQLKREGKEPRFKVPPLKMDRLIYHEVTHVLQGGLNAPGWFTEGMAEMVGDDPNAILHFLHTGKTVRGLDLEITDLNETYARGHLFWKWLEKRGATSKTYELAFVKRVPWKQALEEATNFSWANIVEEEREWSVRELQKSK